MHTEVTDAALKEVDLTVALNASRSHATPIKAPSAMDKSKARESMMLHQILDASLHLNSAYSMKGEVASPNVSANIIKPRVSNLGYDGDLLNKSTLIQVLQGQG